MDSNLQKDHLVGLVSNSINFYQLHAADWKAYRKIRLQALLENPESFLSSFAAESELGKAYWVSMLNDATTAVFGLFDGKELIGSARCVIRPIYSLQVQFSASYIQKEYRGKGLSKYLYDARIAWAKHRNCTRIWVAHLQGNTASKFAIQKAGFIFEETEFVQYGKREGPRF